MEETGQNTNTGKVISANFKAGQKAGSEIEARKSDNAKTVSNQSNPILSRLFKLTHSELRKDKEDYRSFSGFLPKDLR